MIGRKDILTAGRTAPMLEAVVERAMEVQAEQSAFVLSQPSAVELQYPVALAAFVEAKRGQVAGLEDKLEGIIEAQSSKLQMLQASQPSMLSLPSTKRRWQEQVQNQNSSIARLHSRLDTVREIKEGMGVHSSRVEDLAARKLRREDPDLCEQWDALRLAQRQHEAIRRQEAARQKKERGLLQDDSRSMKQSLSMTMVR